jgi:hypothetical protein
VAVVVHHLVTKSEQVHLADQVEAELVTEALTLAELEPPTKVMPAVKEELTKLPIEIRVAEAALAA